MIKGNAARLYERDLERGGVNLQKAYQDVTVFALRETMHVYQEADCFSGKNAALQICGTVLFQASVYRGL